MTYLRRMLVPVTVAPTVINHLKANVTDDLMVTEVTIGGVSYHSIKFVSANPVVVFNAGGATVSRKGTKPTVKAILEDAFSTDKDIGTLYVDPTDYANADVNSTGSYNITVVLESPDGVVGSEEWVLTITDTSAPVITLTATTADIAAVDVATWDPATNIASALDDGDDVSGSVVMTYFEDSAVGTPIADLAGARTHLGTESNVVYVAYNYTDAGGNPAVEKSCTFTAVA